MNRIIIFILALCFGISIAFPVLYIYQPIFTQLQYNTNQQKTSIKLVCLYTMIFSIIFAIVFMSFVVSIQQKCLN